VFFCFWVEVSVLAVCAVFDVLSCLSGFSDGFLPCSGLIWSFGAFVLFVIVVCACFRCDLGPRFPLGFLRVFAVRSSVSIV